MLIRKSKPSCCQLSKHSSLVPPFGYSKRQLPVNSSATAKHQLILPPTNS
ncbi:TPA: hypothetical protein SUP44_000722 [Streptococcus equi subsp. equi]|nr:hypothetical protein [Streptococcus equi subsp. equi]